MAIIFRVFPPQQRGLGWVFIRWDGPSAPSSVRRSGVPDGYAQLARHFLHQPAPGDHWRGAGGDRHGRRPQRPTATPTRSPWPGDHGDWGHYLAVGPQPGESRGVESQYIVWLFVIAAVSLVLFVLIELWVGDPLVDLRLYRNATYSMATLVGYY